MSRLWDWLNDHDYEVGTILVATTIALWIAAGVLWTIGD